MGKLDLKTPLLGGISGVIADVATHPIATVKTRIQVQGFFQHYRKHFFAFSFFRCVKNVGRNGLPGEKNVHDEILHKQQIEVVTYSSPLR